VADLLGWQVYDQELLEYTAQNPFIRQELFTSLSDEGRDWTEELFGKLGVADKGESVQHLVRVILALGTQGGLVLVGRGAGFILPMETTLRVRIVAPLEDRIAYVRQAERLNREEAAEAVRSRDERRERFVREQLGQSIEAVHGYGLVLNSSELSEEGSAEIIAAALRWKVKQG
jgi:cytidylate kinase